MPISFNTYKTRKPRRNASKRSSELYDYIQGWASMREATIRYIRREAASLPDSWLDGPVIDDLARHLLLDVGNNRTTWMERSITSDALLMDRRSKRFGKRLLDRESWEGQKVVVDYASLSLRLDDEWIEAGGREDCRHQTICPHCHARWATRLVGRVEAGPWRSGRRPGHHLVIMRVTVPTAWCGWRLEA